MAWFPGLQGSTVLMGGDFNQFISEWGLLFHCFRRLRQFSNTKTESESDNSWDKLLMALLSVGRGAQHLLNNGTHDIPLECCLLISFYFFFVRMSYILNILNKMCFSFRYSMSCSSACIPCKYFNAEFRTRFFPVTFLGVLSDHFRG